jgi:hypothetical protein
MFKGDAKNSGEGGERKMASDKADMKSSDKPKDEKPAKKCSRKKK